MGRSAEAWAEQLEQQAADDADAAWAHQQQLEEQELEAQLEGMTPEELLALQSDPAYLDWLDKLNAEERNDGNGGK